MNLARFRLVTFDVTDTILQFRYSLGKQYSDIGALYGVKCDEELLGANFKTHWYKLKKEHPNFGKESGITWVEWWKLLVFRTFKDADRNVDEKKLDLVATNLIQMYETAGCWQQCYGALGLLSYLRNKAVPIGIVSNFDERLPRLLENTNLRHYFKFVLTSYEAGFEKPDKRIFQEAIKQSSIPALQSGECLHIGDTISLDYVGAINAGWNSVIIDPKNIGRIKERHSNVNPDDVFRNLYDLHKYFVETDAMTK